MTVFLDTAVLIYAAGSAHPLREPCRRLLRRVADGELEAVTSAEVIQEILHRYTRIGRPDTGAALARASLDLLAPVLPLTHALMRRLPDLVERYPDHGARDLVHVATCLHEGIREIISPDRGFDAVDGIHRIDPGDFAKP
jgi:predicted nucleic acid-binding protein